MQFIQPRHTYAPDTSVERYGHIYFPTALYIAASRLKDSGVTVSVHDENLGAVVLSDDVVGVGVIGAPYIPSASKLLARLESDRQVCRMVGGQGVAGLSVGQIETAFGSTCINGNSDKALAESIGLSGVRLIPAEAVSMKPLLRELDDELFTMYFAREFPFYLSQGCKFSCSFCAAKRSFRDPATGKVRATREVYRDIRVAADEIAYISSRAYMLGIDTLTVYLSNLDVFQTPAKLEEFVSALEEANLKSEIKFRGLATTKTFLEVHQNSPELISRFVDLGLYRLGFGVDGATSDVWRATRKPQTSEDCLTALSTARLSYGIEPETLMVFGHQGHEDRFALDLAVGVTKRLWNELEAIPRPHVAKDVVPGNDGWSKQANSGKVSFLLQNQDAFQMLDFTCLPSWLTHDDDAFRSDVTWAYLEICKMPQSLTQYVKPEDPTLPTEDIQNAKLFNLKKYDV